MMRAWIQIVFFVLLCGSAHAQNILTLKRWLTRSNDFRVRVQAALALGKTRDASAESSLERALSDRNPAVRAAAATALGQLGDMQALNALRRAQRDSSRDVRLQAERAIAALRSKDAPRFASAGAPPDGASEYYPPIRTVPSADDVSWRGVRYVMMLGDMRDRSERKSNEFATSLREAVDKRLRELGQIAVFQVSVPRTAAVEREIRRRALPKIRIEGSVVRGVRRVGAHELSVRCEVSFMLLDEPDRILRGILRGAATGVGIRRSNSTELEERLSHQALAGAVESALAKAHQALAQVRQ